MRLESKAEVWVFFDPDSQRKTKPLSLAQAKQLISNMSPEQLSVFYLWTVGWKDWIRIDRYLDSEESILPPIPADSTKTKHQQRRGTMVTRTAFQIPDKTIFVSGAHNVGELTRTVKVVNRGPKSGAESPSAKSPLSKAAPKTEKRKESRHRWKLEVVVSAFSGKSFRTFAVDISTGGIQLEKPLPVGFTGKLDVVIINKSEPNLRNNRLLLKGGLVGDIRDPRHLAFVASNSATASKLKAFVEKIERDSSERAS